jgi:type IX secretion system PorP/SprF family membrane protein
MMIAGSNYRNVLMLIVAALALSRATAQQDPQYTQYMFNMLAINPAYAGSGEQLSLKALSRHQWVGFDGNPTTQTLTGHSTVWHESLALGGTLIRDEHGPVSQYGLFADVAYRIFFDRSKLAFGLKIGANYFQGDFAELSPLDATDPVFQQSVNGKIDPQFGFGLMLYDDRYYVGLSVPRILNTKFFDADTLETFAQAGQRDHFMLSGGYVFELSNYVKFKPTALIKGVNGAPWSFDLSANFLFYEKFWLGAMYRHEDAIGVMAQYEFIEGLSAGYAYDLTLSDLRAYNSGSHEIMISYQFGDPNKGIRSPRYF